jgi:hypothetical protein
MRILAGVLWLSCACTAAQVAAAAPALDGIVFDDRDGDAAATAASRGCPAWRFPTAARWR